MHDINEVLHRNVLYGIWFWNEWTLWIYFELFLKSLFDYWYVFSDFFSTFYSTKKHISRVVWSTSHMDEPFGENNKICYEH